MRSKIIPLPVDSFLTKVERISLEHQNLVIVAEPGAGKTTRIPPLLTQIFLKKVLVLEPRRVAAIAAAHRICEENNWNLGSEAGFQIRFDNKTSANTRLIFLTEAILARRLLNDPQLSDVSVVVFDEFHERSADTDLTLGLLREQQILGNPIKIIVMSATLDAQKIAKFLDNAPILNIPGSQFEPQLFYSADSMKLRLDRDFYLELRNTVSRAVQKGSGDTLVFLPGKGEISRAKDELESHLPPQFIIETLHGNSSIQDQTRILRSSTSRRVILATNIAESSITIDGVDAVVDSGLSRVSRFDLRTRSQNLELTRISQASAKQRAGRSSRQRQGFAFRMWSQAEQALLRPFDTPEISRTELSQHVLFLAALGVSDPKTFLWFDPPGDSQLDQSVNHLFRLGAIGKNGSLSDLGREMLRWPVDPDSAALLATANSRGQLATACQIVAILGERDFLKPETIDHHLADNWESDILLRLNLLQKPRSSDTFSDVVERVQKVARQLHGSSLAATPIDHRDLASLLLSTWPFRLCVRRSDDDRGVMVGGSGVKLSKNSTVIHSKFFLALDLMSTPGSKDISVRLATGITSDVLKNVLKSQLQTKNELYFDEIKQKYFMVKQLTFEGLVVESAAPIPAPQELIKDSLGQLAAQRWDWILDQNEKMKRWYERLKFYFSKRNRQVPDIEELKVYLNRASLGFNSLSELAKSDLVFHLSGILTHKELEEFEKYVPDFILAPTGTKMIISYPENQSPSVQIRLQEVFGMLKTPVLLDNTPLVMHLLAPNYRPVQTTSDLEHFWKSTYFEVKRELKSRYPKHSWPDDPIQAQPVAKGRGRR